MKELILATLFILATVSLANAEARRCQVLGIGASQEGLYLELSHECNLFQAPGENVYCIAEKTQISAFNAITDVAMEAYRTGKKVSIGRSTNENCKVYWMVLFQDQG